MAVLTIDSEASLLLHLFTVQAFVCVPVNSEVLSDWSKAHGLSLCVCVCVCVCEWVSESVCVYFWGLRFSSIIIFSCNGFTILMKNCEALSLFFLHPAPPHPCYIQPHPPLSLSDLPPFVSLLSSSLFPSQSHLRQMTATRPSSISPGLNWFWRRTDWPAMSLNSWSCKCLH